MYKTTLLLTAIVFLLVGCAGSGSERVRNTIRESIGTYTPADINVKVPQVLTTRHPYVMERSYNTSEQIYFETRWQETVALEDEAALGAEMTRHRIVVEARPSNRSAETTITYRVNVRAERQGRMVGSAEWDPFPVTAMAREEMKEVIDDLKRQLESGIQRF